MNWADWSIVAIVAVSSLISIKRGFVKEAISLAIWALAFFVAVTFADRMAVLLHNHVASASVRFMLSFAALFVATFIVGAMVNYLLGELIRMTGLSGADRLFGMAFGLARGVIVIMALLIFAPMVFPISQDQWWQQSMLIPHFLLMEQWCRDSFAFLLDWALRLAP
jgi:membrane protein required for colicin V production